MGYNSNCITQTCTLGCCASNGRCPATSSGCSYYYYNNSYNLTASVSVNVGAIAGPIVSVVTVITVGIFVYRWWKARQAQQVQSLSSVSDNNNSKTIIINDNNNAYGQTIVPAYPVMTTPTYIQPAPIYTNPVPYVEPVIYSQPPIYNNPEPYSYPPVYNNPTPYNNTSPQK